MPHELSFEDLLDYVEGRLTPAELARTEAHIHDGCTQCTADAAWLQRTLGLMAGDRLADAPERAVRRAQAFYHAPRRQPKIVVMAALTSLWQGLRALRLRPVAAGSALAGLWQGLRAPRLRPVVAAVLVVLMVVAGTWAWGETNVVQAATLAEVQGPVEVRIAGDAGWQPAVPGTTLTAGCAVRAGDGGLAVILYADGSRSYLAERTEVQLLELSGQRNQGRTTMRLSQTAGHTQHQLASSASLLQVQAGDARVEGSAAVYDVWVSDGDVDVVPSRGQVTLKNDKGKAGVSEGEYGHAAKGKVEVSTPAPTATPPAHGQGKPPAKEKADADAEPKPKQKLEPLQITPAASEHTPPGQSKAKDSKPAKIKIPRLHWPWSHPNKGS